MIDFVKNSYILINYTKKEIRLVDQRCSSIIEPYYSLLVSFGWEVFDNIKIKKYNEDNNQLCS